MCKPFWSVLNVRRKTVIWVAAGHAAVFALLIGGTGLPSCQHSDLIAVPVAVVEAPAPVSQRSAPAQPEHRADPDPVAPNDDTTQPGKAAPEETASPPDNVDKQPAWQARSPEEIRREARLKREATTDRSKKTSERTVPDSRDIARRLEQSVANVRTRLESATDRRVATASGNRYLAVISRILHRAWEQPASAELDNGGTPGVAASLRIGADGRILSSRLTRQSNSATMNASVQHLFRDLERLPPPQQYGITTSALTVNITFELD